MSARETYEQKLLKQHSEILSDEVFMMLYDMPYGSSISDIHRGFREVIKKSYEQTLLQRKLAREVQESKEVR